MDEYRLNIEKDGALERRFQPVRVEQPTVEDTVSILRGLKEKYEVHHGIRIQDPALVAAVQLSHRYIADRQLPDKAIDLIDEAASRIRLQLDSKPAEIDVIARRITSLEIELVSLKNEHDADSNPRIPSLENELSVHRAEHDELFNRWQEERRAQLEVRGLRESLEELRNEEERVRQALPKVVGYEERERMYQKAGELSARIQTMKSDIESAEATLAQLHEQGQFLVEEVAPGDIAEIVTRWTGIPVDKLLGSEAEKLLDMEGALHQRVIGQAHAVQLVSDAVRRSRAAWAIPIVLLGVFSSSARPVLERPS